MSELIHILIVDDHPIVRQTLCALLIARHGMKVVGEAVDGAEAVAMARDLRPDVILMDLVMPKSSGVEATANILRDNPEARVLILTSFGADENVGQVLQAEARGLSNQQIAENFGIGANTVRTHVGSLLRKLGLSNRTELAIYAIKREPR